MTPNEMFEKWVGHKSGESWDKTEENKQLFLVNLKEVMRGIVPEEDDGYKSDCKDLIEWAVRWNSCRSEILRRIGDIK